MRTAEAGRAPVLGVQNREDYKWTRATCRLGFASMNSVIMVPAWQRNDAKVAGDAMHFWRALKALPRGVTAEERARELCAAAYIGDELVGVSTIALGYSQLVRCRLGFFRCLVSPAHPDRRLARRLTLLSRQLLSDWSNEHPEEKILGMAAILESPNFDRLGKRPIWPETGLWLVGYMPDGRQIRLTWFDHARLE